MFYTNVVTNLLTKNYSQKMSNQKLGQLSPWKHIVETNAYVKRISMET